MKAENNTSIRLLNKDEFANTCLLRLKQAGETRPLRYDPVHYCLTDDDTALDLDQPYSDYCLASVEHRETLFAQFISFWVSQNIKIPTDFEAVAPALRPIIWKRSFLEIQKLASQCDGKRFRVLPFVSVGQSFAVGLGLEMEQSCALVYESHCSSWNVKVEQATQVAINNLRGLKEATFQVVAPGLFQVLQTDSYATSRLLLPDVIRRQAVSGDHIAMIPNDRSLLLTGSEDPEGLANMARLADQLLKGPCPRSGMPLRLCGDSWIPFLPGHHHATRRQFERLQVESNFLDYDAQQIPLQMTLDPKLETVFVSHCFFFPQDEAETPRTFCIWCTGIDVLLPKADVISFTLNEDKANPEILARTEWDRAVDIVGDLMIPQGLYPERWRVNSFPNPAQIAKLEAAQGWSR
jgi:hypothetical protein